MTFDPNSDLIWGLSVGQQGKISSAVFTDIDKTTGTLCPESAHTSKKLSQKPPVYVSRKKKHYPIPKLFLIVLLYIVEAKKGCKKNSLNILSLAADLLKLR